MNGTRGGWILETLDVVVFGKNTLDHRFDVVFHRGGNDAWQALIEVLNVVSYIVGITYHILVADFHLAVHVQVGRRNLVRDTVFV